MEKWSKEAIERTKDAICSYIDDGEYQDMQDVVDILQQSLWIIEHLQAKIEKLEA